ncbi:MAG TPA: cyclopropane fatty acyl phospholipid synthase [Caulobacteraceae bacterium]|nr:cyclopropane fatty acyl phospholipid synthase [Caulobacteraceae bacterium]
MADAQAISTPSPGATRRRGASGAEAMLARLLADAEITLNGPEPWDPQVHNPEVYARVVAEGSLGFGEAYMDGWWDCERLDTLFERIVAHRIDKGLRPSMSLIWLVLNAHLQNRQSKSRVWDVAQIHYDLDVDVFEATFDKRLTGSCGYWAKADNLDAAQEAKLDLVCRKIGLQAGERVLDIGCGWGAFMGFAAERYGATCVGVTVSQVQADYGRKRYAGLPVEFQVKDYRDFEGRVDRIASMGMFEHVGARNYRTYFESARRWLADDGLFLLHTIWANDAYPTIDPWLDKYIFPNGCLPTVGQVGDAVEGLFVIENVENFGPDYDRTLMAWRAKFQTNRAAISAKYGERFCRMWDYYLCCCAGGFRSRGINVGQFVLSPKGVPGGWRLNP